MSGQFLGRLLLAVSQDYSTATCSGISFPTHHLPSPFAPSLQDGYHLVKGPLLRMEVATLSCCESTVLEHPGVSFRDLLRLETSPDCRMPGLSTGCPLLPPKARSYGSASTHLLPTTQSRVPRKVRDGEKGSERKLGNNPDVKMRSGADHTHLLTCLFSHVFHK